MNPIDKMRYSLATVVLETYRDTDLVEALRTSEANIKNINAIIASVPRYVDVPEYVLNMWQFAKSYQANHPEWPLLWGFEQMLYYASIAAKVTRRLPEIPS